MARPPRPPPLYLLAVVFFLLPVQPPPAADAATAVAFSFPSFSLRNLTLLGGASLRSASVTLPPPSSHALFPLPLPFPRNASFSTTFLFASPASARPASRLSFLLLPDPLAAAAEAPPTNRSLPPPLEVSFDAPKNRVYASSAGDRVAANSTGAVDLRNGNEVASWVVYDARRARLEVFLGHASLRPPAPALVVPNSTGLAARFADFMFVGFQVSSSSSDNNGSSVDGGGFAIHSWSFQTSGLPAANLASRPSHNVSDSSVRRGPAASDRAAGPASDVRRRRLALGLGIPLPILFLGAVVVFAAMSLRKRRARAAGLNDGGARAKAAGQPREFMYQDLFAATKGFDPSLVVGSGGFGTVYRAVCPRSGVTYAVKRSKQSRESRSEFTAELTIIADLKHPNLVQLRGWCAEKDELLLVYEFMSNGSLDMALHPVSDSGVHRYPTLSWARRYNVAVGIASAVAYLHEEHEQQVIHRDIKCSNILLDSQFNPRLGDFGLARLKDPNNSPRSTLAAGTVGYLAPEYLQMGRATEKSDVYSYGVVLLEICTRRRPIEREAPGSMNMLNVVDWVWNLHSKGKLLDAVDSTLDGEYDTEQMMRLLLLGLSCVNPFSEERPVMRTVLDILEGRSEPLPVPKKKPLLVFVSNAPIDFEGIVSECNQSTVSSDLFELKIDIN
ncbi:probable L-type lectin-domain containing receptor kinase S.7 [Lolium rigidum]|uniref:probable L-type lectin-domain containing receptor kinase S.7 n=1 Tax=Lolium rigidum TaxID=89674 RepID=UPI001F5CAF83|nr:probable L-type lectin-domain containing receptor kinase S.7 [Lolium rigidum]